MREKTTVGSSGEAMARVWRNRTVTKALLFAGIVASGLYVFGDLLSGLVYNASRPYSFRDQWISELTALGSPVRPLMVAVITAHNILLVAFGLGIWRAAGRSRSLRWVGLGLVATTMFASVIHPFFPMASRWNFTDTPMHGILSVAWSFGISAVVILAAVAYRGWFRLYSIGTVLFMMAFGIASGIAFRGIDQNDTPWAGAFERINAYVLMAWLVVLAVTVIHRRVERTTEEHGATDGPQTRSLPGERAMAASR
jgi:Protein of unknown function (DUF998)